MASEKVYIKGMGMISAIGFNVQEALHSLRELKYGVGPITHLDTVYKGTIPVAEVKKTNEELKNFLCIDTDTVISRTCLLGMCAASEAVNSAGIDTGKFRCGIVSATSVGGMDLSEIFYDEFYNDHSKGDNRYVKSHDCADSTMRIALFLGIKDFQATISTACSSSANAIMYASRLIKNNILDIAIAGGTDSLTRFTVNGFNTLMILDKNHCRPFDAGRAGLNIGEGAGYVVLVSEKVLNETQKEAFAEVKGYGNANDAYHQTASSPDGQGAFLAMSKAMSMSGLQPYEIDYINVHGTGTGNNDLSEGIAMKRIFGDHVPLFSSTKPFTGHTLGAAGGIEAIISILAIKNKLVFPNLNFKEPIPELNISPVTRLTENVKVTNVLSNSFGFGGNNSSLILSEV
ncbi:MAG: beta-ketoacyl-[acyl-carrier-protein] synthase family protein [Bacteroidales bacterium]|jgi:3-oxoacyl-[acyl-carrier-protein] synthase-1|nr:beta-ketoacyl-[acyl-carrier-protein] synthase family protein [Bacteroidales bacterium]